MTNKLQALRSDFVEKVERLEGIKETLKQEFVGIDHVIDDVVDNVRSWYTMASIQERPSVINLWGLTGVGKTSMITRMMELLEFSDKTYRIDLGEKDGNLSFRNSLSDLCDNKDDSPIVILLDEFQHARTVKGNGPFREEVADDKTRMVWELIDSGKITYTDYKRALWIFEDLTLKLTRLVQAGLEVKNGIVTKGVDLFKREFDLQEEKGPIRFVQEYEYDNIIDLAGRALNLHFKHEVESHLLKLDGRESAEFLQKVVRAAQKPSIKSFRQALVVILGNIDEAYTMSSNYSSEISADDFYEQSLKITVPIMKEALRNRFRNEQIARLGNTHIIYPALGEKAYYQIIDLQLNKLDQKMKDEFGIAMSFDQSLKDILYKEGVYPTQGARPLLTTIQSIVKSRISIYLNRILKHDLKTDHLHLYIEDETQLACGFYENEKLKFTYSDTLHLNLESLRKPKNDEMQAIAAVHESGHAVLSSILLSNIPELVVSVTSDSNAVGFVYSKDQKDYLAKHELIAKAAVQLGGIMAEELIFGEDHVTAGASSDLMQATNFIMHMLKNEGMGSAKVRFASTTVEDTMSFHDTQEIEQEAFAMLDQAKELAHATLLKERKLLLVLSEILADRSKIEKEELIDLIAKHATTPVLHQDKSSFYRDKLKAQLQTQNILKEINSSNPIQLNKNKA